MTARQHMWEFECDRCGNCTTTSEYAPPPGWGHHIEVGDLCPGCVTADWVWTAEAYRRLIEGLEWLLDDPNQHLTDGVRLVVPGTRLKALIDEERQKLKEELTHHDRDS